MPCMSLTTIPRPRLSHAQIINILPNIILPSTVPTITVQNTVIVYIIPTHVVDMTINVVLLLLRKENFLKSLGKLLPSYSYKVTVKLLQVMKENNSPDGLTTVYCLESQTCSKCGLSPNLVQVNYPAHSPLRNPLPASSKLPTQPTVLCFYPLQTSKLPPQTTDLCVYPLQTFSKLSPQPTVLCVYPLQTSCKLPTQHTALRVSL